MASRKELMIFMLIWLAACGDRDSGKVKKSTKDGDFAQKRFCSEFGRARQQEDEREHADSGLDAIVNE